MIASSHFSQEQAQDLVRGCFADLINQAEARGGFLPEGPFPELEVSEQHELSMARVGQLRDQLLTNAFDGFVRETGDDTLARKGLSLSHLSSTEQADLLSGIARAKIEEQRHFQLRLTDRLGTFLPEDDLFKPIAGLAAAAIATAPHLGLSVADAIDRYLDYGRAANWVRKTIDARTWQLRFFGEHVGSALPLAAVTVDHIRTYRDAVRRLHKRHGKIRGSFQQRQTASINHRISDKTALVTFDPVKAFLRWARSVEGLISTNPADDVRIVIAKKVKGGKARRPFSADELATLFSSPMFTGCKSGHRRYEAGPHIIRDAKYWLPILGYYTGARLGELVQLHFCDVRLDDEIPSLSINEENAADVAERDRKHVKSDAGVRIVPLHPDIMALGFGDFVARRRRHRSRTGARLFHDFSFGSDGQASTVASKFFARLMDKVGLSDPALVFHSFRHNAEDAFRDALTPQFVTDRIIGHADGATSATYGNGVALDVMYNAVKNMRLPYRVFQG